MKLFFHAFILLSICCHFIQGSYLMSTIAGDGSDSSGDGGPATSAGIHSFLGMWVDSLGNIFIPDSSMLQLRKVDTAGIIRPFLGSGLQNYTGNGGPALSVELDAVGCVVGDTAGNIYLTSNQYSIWYYNQASGQVSRFAGATPANYGYSGDGGPATSAVLSGPLGVFLSTNGILYFVDAQNIVVRAIDTKTNIITTIAGSATATALGDGGPATSAMMQPYGVWGNTAGVLYIGDLGSGRIRKVAMNGIITTVAGTGNFGYNGDNILATNANLNNPYNCQEDSLGNLYISDFGHRRVRMVSTTGIITTIAGDGSSTIADGSVHVATAVGLLPSMIQLDNSGTIYFGDGGDVYAYARKLSTAPPSIVTTGIPTESPSTAPTVTRTKSPSPVPTVIRTKSPSTAPTLITTAIPTEIPSAVPTAILTESPSTAPTLITTAIPTEIPSAVPTAILTESPSTAPTLITTAIPTEIPSAVPTAISTPIITIVPSGGSSSIPTISPTVVPSFRPSVVNVTVDSSSSSQRLSDLHIFYATFFPAFFVVFCILPCVVYYLWKVNKGKKQMKYDEIDRDSSAAVNGNDGKTVEVGKYYEWSF